MARLSHRSGGMVPIEDFLKRCDGPLCGACIGKLIAPSEPRLMFQLDRLQRQKPGRDGTRHLRELPGEPANLPSRGLSGPA